VKEDIKPKDFTKDE